MSDPGHCFPSNPDISGIGVRSAVYAQNLLSFVPAFFVLLNDREVTPVELETLETQSITILITAFALLVSTIVQAFNHDLNDRLSNFHATIILNLSWMNNTNLFIYFVLYLYSRLADLGRKHESLPADAEGNQGTSAPGCRGRVLWRREMKMALQNTVFIVGSFHLTLMAAVGIWFWRQPFSFGFAPHCSQSALVIFGQLPLTSEGLKGWSLFIYSLLLIPFVNLVVPIVFFSAPSFFWQRFVGPLNPVGQRPVLTPTVLGLTVLAVINVVLLVDTEVTLLENSHLVEGGDTDWTFGQTLALLLLLVPVRDILETLAERRPKKLGKELLQAAEKGDLSVVKRVCDLGADKRVEGMRCIHYGMRRNVHATIHQVDPFLLLQHMATKVLSVSCSRGVLIWSAAVSALFY